MLAIGNNFFTRVCYIIFQNVEEYFSLSTIHFLINVVEFLAKEKAKIKLKICLLQMLCTEKVSFSSEKTNISS